MLEIFKVYLENIYGAIQYAYGEIRIVWRAVSKVASWTIVAFSAFVSSFLMGVELVQFVRKEWLVERPCDEGRNKQTGAIINLVEAHSGCCCNCGEQAALDRQAFIVAIVNATEFSALQKHAGGVEAQRARCVGVVESTAVLVDHVGCIAQGRQRQQISGAIDEWTIACEIWLQRAFVEFVTFATFAARNIAGQTKAHWHNRWDERIARVNCSPLKWHCRLQIVHWIVEAFSERKWIVCV